MKWRTLVAVGVALLAVESASAQPPGGAIHNPTFSPYLNLTRPGGTPALNYYGLVRPELQGRQALQNLQGAVGANQQAIGGLQTELNELPATGHAATFLNYKSYFLTGGAYSTGGTSGGNTRLPQLPQTPQIPRP